MAHGSVYLGKPWASLLRFHIPTHKEVSFGTTPDPVTVESSPGLQSSHHQDCSISSRESEPKPPFVTGMLGAG